MVEKEVRENGSARLEIYPDAIWIQNGIIGMYLRGQEFVDLYELMTAWANGELVDDEES